MKRWLSFYVSLSFLMGAGMLTAPLTQAMSDAEEISQMYYAMSDDVSVDVQLDELEQILGDNETDSLVSDTDAVVDSFIDESGSVDVDAVEDAINDILDQTEVMVQDENLDAETVLQGNELDTILEQMDVIEGQRRFLPEDLKEKMREFAKARRKMVARFQELKSEIKERRMEAGKRVRDFKGGLRTLLRRANELNKDQKQQAFERIRRQAKEAVDAHKEMVKERIKEEVDMLREKCKEDMEMCKKKLEEKRMSREERHEKVIEKLDARCEMSDDPDKCGERVDMIREKMMERNAEMKNRVDELRSACMDAPDSEECKAAKDEGKMKEQSQDRPLDSFQLRRKPIRDQNESGEGADTSQ